MTARDRNRRIASAMDALDAFVAAEGGDEFEFVVLDLVSDLLADLHHFCDAEGIDFAACLERAARHYREES